MVETIEASASEPFTIERVFDGARERVWRAWTERERLREWWGPEGFTVSHLTDEARVGGMMHYCLRGPDGMELWGKWTYREISRPRRLVVVNAFSDKDGGAGRHPMWPEWPPEMLSTFTFAERDGGTVVGVEWRAINATGAERRVFDANHESCRIGWTGTLDRLEAYLRTAGA